MTDQIWRALFRCSAFILVFQSAIAAWAGDWRWGATITPLTLTLNSPGISHQTALHTGHPLGQISSYLQTDGFADTRVQLSLGYTRSTAKTVALALMSPEIPGLAPPLWPVTRILVGLNHTWVNEYSVYLEGTSPKTHEYGTRASATSLFLGPHLSAPVSDRWAISGSFGAVYEIARWVENRNMGTVPPGHATGHELRGINPDAYAYIGIDYKL